MLYNKILDVQSDESGITEQVTLQEAKDFCRIDISTDDDLISMFITAARKMCEAYTNIGFVQREFTVQLSNPNGGIYLPYGPIEADSVELYDADGDEIEAADYELSTGDFVQILEPWDERIKAVYTGGYEILPAHLKTGLLNTILYLYDNRADGADSIGPISKMILKPFSRVI